MGKGDKRRKGEDLKAIRKNFQLIDWGDDKKDKKDDKGKPNG
jgi:hypothetical protein